MASVFELPAVGDTMVEAEIVEWLVEVGDEVGLDQPICSIETDKSVVEMTTPYRGTVLALGGEPGDVIAVGQPLIVVGSPGEQIPASPAAAAPDGTKPDPAEPDTAAAAGPAEPDTAAAPDTAIDATAKPDALTDAATKPEAMPRTEGAPEPDAAASGSASARPKAMPKVRRMARERSVDLAAVAGTGPGGAVTAADLEAAARLGGERRERLSARRRAIARHLTESVRTIPQFTAMAEADAAGLLAARSAAAEEAGQPVPLDALLTALLVPTLADHPVMNARLDGDDIVYYDRYDIGVAVDAPDGLTVPVVRGADRLSVPELAAEIRRLAAAARNLTIGPGDLAGATATVNNVGAVGITAGTPILPTGTSMIAAFGRARPVVRMRGGRPEEAPVITVCATFDHRIIDGGGAGRFLAQLKDRIEGSGRR